MTENAPRDYEDDDDDGDGTDVASSHDSTWKRGETTTNRPRSAVRVSTQIATKLQPMLDAAVKDVVRQLRYDDQSHLPCFLTTRLADPFITLSHYVDADKIYQKALADIGHAVREHDALGSAEERNAKRKSLRRTFTEKIKPPTKLPNEEITDEARKQHLTTIDAERVIAERIEAEARRLSIKLSHTVDVFVDHLCDIAGIRDRMCKHDLLTFAPYVLVDPSVSRHPRLSRLKLGDNTMVLELGRASVRAFVLLETYAQAYQIENAERRCRELESHAHAWLEEQCGAASIADMLPVQWYLHAQTSEPLDADTIDARSARMRNEMPFIMIGVLMAMRLRAEAEQLIWSLYQKLV